MASSSSQITLYWHDYETWGEIPAQDRPSQFAGVRTDEDLNVIGDPLMIYCKPAPDLLPKPDACLVTGLTPQLAREKGLPECEFVAAIVAELGKPGTCGVVITLFVLMTKLRATRYIAIFMIPMSANGATAIRAGTLLIWFA